MGRSRWAVLGALAVLAAACSDPAALAPADTEPEAVSGPTVVTTSPATTEVLPTTPPLPTIPRPPAPPEPVTVLAAGNLGACTDESTQLAEAMVADSGWILALGDLSPDGTTPSVAECFSAIFEPAFDRLLAVPGDRDLATGDPAAFEAVVAESPTSASDQGWFAASVGAWQIIGLNSRCEDADGCDAESAQYQWLDQLLRDESNECRAVLWHDARFSSVEDQPDAVDMGALVGRLDGAGADILMTGGVSGYERLGPLRPGGAPVAEGEYGIQHFNIGGVGGAVFDDPPRAGSMFRAADTSGYVRFELSPGSYTWEFMPTSDGAAESDSGVGIC